MPESSLETRLQVVSEKIEQVLHEQVLLERATNGDQEAASELIDIAVQYLGGDGIRQKADLGANLLEKLAKIGNKEALEQLASFAVVLLDKDPKFSFKWLNVANELGHLKAKRNLALCFFYGKGTDIDTDKAIQLLQECYQAGRKLALEELNSVAAQLLSGEDPSIKQDLKKAVEVFTYAAERGDKAALRNLNVVGEQFYCGTHPCPKNVDRGIAIFKLAARLGNAESLNNLNGAGSEIIEERPKEAFELFRIANELGHPQAKSNLGVCFLNGMGTEKDINKAIRLFKEAYEQGHKAALQDLNSIASNMLPLKGTEGTPDLKKAVELLIFVAQEGDPIALKNLSIVGTWFCSGTSDCPKDLKQGIPILEMAARLGNKVALNNLVAVATELVEQDFKTAMELFTVGSDLGNLSSKRNLAILLLDSRQGESIQIDKAIELLKACYEAGDTSILEDLNTLAADFVMGRNGYKKDIDLAVNLLAYAAQHGHQKAKDNLYQLTNHSKETAQPKEGAISSVAPKALDKKQRLECLSTQTSKEQPKGAAQPKKESTSDVTPKTLDKKQRLESLNTQTPEHAFRTAAASGWVEEMRELAEQFKTLDINQPGAKSGRTALHFSAIYGKEKVAQTLINMGARQDTRDTQGNLASDYAKKSGNEGLKKLFGIK